MSQEHAEVVRRDVAARAARDWSTLDQIWHPEVELVLVGGSGVFRGIDEITRFFDSLSDSYDEYRVKAHEMIDAGDRVVTVEWVAGRGLKGSDATAWIHTDLFRMISFEDGKIRKIEEYPSKGEALEAAGLQDQAMSQENVEVVRQVYEAFDRLDEPHVLALMETGLVDADAELDLGTAYPDGPVVRIATLHQFLDTMPWGRSLRFEPESFRAASGGRVLVFVRLHAVGGESGVEVEGRYAHLFALRNGRVVSVEAYSDRAKALDAAGLRE